MIDGSIPIMSSRDQTKQSLCSAKNVMSSYLRPALSLDPTTPCGWGYQDRFVLHLVPPSMARYMLKLVRESIGVLL